MTNASVTCWYLLLSNLFLFPAFAQQDADRDDDDFNRRAQIAITGRIIDKATDKPIEYANIRVCSARDSSLVTGTVSKMDGSFSLPTLPAGSYFVDIRFMGYLRKLIPVEITTRASTPLDLGRIIIEPDPLQFKEIVVEGNRTPISYQIDKKVIDVGKMQTVISGTAADVLQNVPSVTVDLEGNVSLRGSTNFTVLIDGRPTVLAAQDALQQIPATSIQTIEIITNPSAKYDPEGTSGIVNILIKKNRERGLSGVANTTAGVYESYGGDFFSQYRTESFTILVGGNYNRRNFPGTSRSENSYSGTDLTSFLNSSGTNESQREGSGFRSSVEFNATQSTLLTAGGRLGHRGGVQTNHLWYSEWSAANPLTNTYTGAGSFDRGGDFYEANFSVLQRFNRSGHELTAEGNFGYDEDNESSVTTEQSGAQLTGGERLDNNGPAREFEGRVDYTLPFSEDRKFESGYEGQAELSEEHNTIFQFNTTLQRFDAQPQFNYSVKYRNSDHALYSTYSDKFLGVGLQAGLRTEYTYRSVILDREQQRFTIDRWDLFPTLHASMKLSEFTQAMASYTRRIQRPHGWEMEPYIVWTDANNVRKGNPGLQPQFIDSYEAGIHTMVLGATLSADGYYRMVHNKIERIKSVYQPGVTLTSMGNIGRDRSIGSEYMLILDPFKPWNVNLMANLYDYRVTGVLPDGGFERSSFNWNARWNNVIKFDPSTQLQVNLNYNSPTISSQGRSEDFFSVDLAAKRSLFDRFLTVTLQVRDLFGTAVMENTSQGTDFYSYSYAKRDAPLVMLNLRWNFNTFEQDERDDREKGRQGEDQNGSEGDSRGD